MILSPENEYLVVLDACVLAPMPICDTLLRLASEPAMYQVRWSEAILTEVTSFLTKRSYTQEQVTRRIQTMRDYFPEAIVSGFESLRVCWDLPDPRDWHVMAAAIVGHANAIVTANLKHFPERELEQVGILIQHPDEFLFQQFHLNKERVQQTIIEQASACHRETSWLIERLKEGNPKFVSALLENGGIGLG